MTRDSLALAILCLGWFAVGCALAYRIRDNRKRYRIRRAHDSLRAWVRNRGRWHDFDE